MNTAMQRGTAMNVNTTMDPMQAVDHKEAAQSMLNKYILPISIYMVVLFLLGLPGNTMVVIVYSRNKRKTPTQFIMIAMATADLLTVAVLPGTVYTLWERYEFPSSFLCRAIRVGAGASTVSEVFLLLAVSIIRYYKVCRPEKPPISMSQAKIMCLVISIATFILVIPMPLVSGLEKAETHIKGEYGYTCRFDEWNKKHYPVLFKSFFITLLGIFIMCMTSFTVLYILIGLTAFKHRHIHGVAHLSSDANNNHHGIDLELGSSKGDVSDIEELSSDSGSTKIPLQKYDSKLHATCKCIRVLISRHHLDLNGDESTSLNNDKSGTHVIPISDIEEEVLSDNGSPKSPKQPYKFDSNLLVSKCGRVLISRHFLDLNGDESTRVNNDKSGTHVIPDSVSLKEDYPSRSESLKRSQTHRSESMSRTISKPVKSRRHHGFGKTTKMLSVIIVIYMLAYLPSAILKVTVSEQKGLFDLSESERWMYFIATHTFYIGCATNPIIYSFIDDYFRKECLKLLKMCKQN